MGETRHDCASLEGLLNGLVVACRILAADGQGDMVWGHVSVGDLGGRACG